MTFENYYVAENILDWPEQLAIVKLSEPRVFVRFNYRESYFASYEDWRAEIVVVEWLDGEKPDAQTQEKILIDCWNFLALTEEEEERLFEQREEDGDD